MSLLKTTSIICFFLWLNAWGQEFNYDNFSIDDGLPSSQVYEIFESKDGYIWFLTNKGVSRYDGYSFETFTQNDGLSDNIFYEYFIDDSGNAWIFGANNTLTKIEFEPLIFKPYEYNDTLKSQSSSIPNQFILEENGTLYATYLGCADYLQISEQGEVLNTPKRIVFDGVTLTVETVHLKQGVFSYLLAHPTTQTSSIQATNFMKIWATTTEQMVVISENKTINIIKDSSSKLIQTDYRPTGVGEFNDESFWVSFSQNGLMVFDQEGRLKNHYLQNKSVSSFLIDREGNYWFGTLNNGVYHTKNSSIQTINLPQGFSPNINSIHYGGDQRIMITTFQGEVGEIKNDSIALVFQSNDQSNVQICYDELSENWFYSAKEIIQTVDGSYTLKTNHTSGGYALLVKDDKVVCCSYATFQEYFFNGIHHHIRVPAKIKSLREYNRVFYLGTSKGLMKRETKDTVASFVFVDSTKTYPVRDVAFYKGYILVATGGFGIEVYKDEKWICNVSKNVLNSGFVNKIHVDEDLNVWVCSDGGLSKLTWDEKNVHVKTQNLSYADGLATNEVKDMVIVNDTIWLATSNGVCKFHKTLIDKKQIKQNKNYFLELKNVWVNDEVIDTSHHTFSYNENRFAFRFSGIGFLSQKPLLYRYKLREVEQKWNYTIKRNALYTNLAPDRYEFVVQVKGNNSRWTDQQQTFAFEIYPPYWKTWWFISLVVLAVAFLIYLFFKYRILLYNGDIVREILRYVMKRIKGETGYIIVKESGKEVKIASSSIYYVKSDGNYLEIHHQKGKTVIREKIGNFSKLVPDPLEYLRVRRSYIIRIDKVEEKGKKEVVVKGETIQVGKTYLEELDKIQL